MTAEPTPRTVVASGALVVALGAINVTDHLRHPSWRVRLAEGAALVACARLDGLTLSQLGLGKDRLASGRRWALGAIGIVAGVYGVGVLLPPTRPAFRDRRYDLPLDEALWTAFVVIPLGTVVLEELAFRSVLWGFLSRHLRPKQVLVATSAVFGLWHVLPALQSGGPGRGLPDAIAGREKDAVVLATVGVTTAGGLVFGELRRRSGSVLAGAGAHWATNALGVLGARLAWRLSG